MLCAVQGGCGLIDQANIRPISGPYSQGSSLPPSFSSSTILSLHSSSPLPPPVSFSCPTVVGTYVYVIAFLFRFFLSLHILFFPFHSLSVSLLSTFLIPFFLSILNLVLVLSPLSLYPSFLQPLSTYYPPYCFAPIVLYYLFFSCCSAGKLLSFLLRLLFFLLPPSLLQSSPLLSNLSFSPQPFPCRMVFFFLFTSCILPFSLHPPPPHSSLAQMPPLASQK